MMKRLPVNLWDRQHEALKAIAYKEKTSMSDVVRDAVDDYLKKKSKASRDDNKRKLAANSGFSIKKNNISLPDKL